MSADEDSVEDVQWCSVRCVFEVTVEDQRVYEERITLWHAADVDDAIAMAEAEAREYAGSAADVVYLGLAQAYLLPSGVEHGAEVFSLMRASTLPPEDYLDRFFDTGAERQTRPRG